MRNSTIAENHKLWPLGTSSNNLLDTSLCYLSETLRLILIMLEMFSNGGKFYDKTLPAAPQALGKTFFLSCSINYIYTLLWLHALIHWNNGVWWIQKVVCETFLFAKNVASNYKLLIIQLGDLTETVNAIDICMELRYVFLNLKFHRLTKYKLK